MTVAFNEAIVDRSARGIAAAVGRMITRGDLAVGTRLPTVRELSKSLGVSPPTVSEAWQTLTSVGAIDARGRQGTFVRQPTGPGAPRRYRRVTEGPGHFALDLSTGTPPPALLPDVGPVVARVSRQSLTSKPGCATAGRSRPRPSPSSTERWTPSTGWPKWSCVSVTVWSSSTPRSR